MQKQLQAASEAMERLLEPANLVQIAIIAAMVILGWWISRRVRRDLGAADAPAGWRGRAREAAWVAAPFALTLLLLATADGLLHAIRAPTRIIDVAVQLTGLLLLIRVVVYLFRVSLGTRSRIKGWGTPISIVIWVFLSLHLLGWGDDPHRGARRHRNHRRQDPHLGVVDRKAAGDGRRSSSSSRSGFRAGWKSG